uniref:Uncharacterized protein n=1 Tax=Odontella aurita TaxID=265563 RepID=A0A7S4JK31_9STRA|mmetsp:Transcript_47765/g.144449  ORF Transcript_47765/g.144449 Transcript_47765/m.144449 type:complete len:343 (+) Transcript_47765:198-1226(+)|eukprot:CAMPEP_0113551750 /NCGR_PEP_ID=MMETSP0015_2-20120614/14693_1 /TAXON_ID=2838 /ORGANISM="Odontella" /LENGTH=342 /DNA_ID=CAMNT_0000452667 /DNA_START=164 /DNA_END=1192 /DNA_ORIENTATION=+ /assembly_acc=CAM_ASM_000160
MSVQVTRGPLSSPLAQWAVLGIGVVAVAGKENVSAALQRAVRAALQASADGPGGILGSSERMIAPHGQAPIVIHSGPASTASGSSRHITTIAQLTVGATACWVSYIAISTCLPDAVKELLPVTRKFFDGAVASLGQAILTVRNALSAQIDDLGNKQDELAFKQDATHTEVLAARDDLDGLRLDLQSICASVRRCEDSLAAAERRQTYTARGVRLLVRCVGALLPGNATLAGDLEKFSRDAEVEGNNGVDGPATTSPRTLPQVKDALSEAARRREEYRKQQQQLQSVGGGCNPQMQSPAGKVELGRMDSVPECTENAKRELSRDMSVEDLLSSIKSGNFTVRT